MTTEGDDLREALQRRPPVCSTGSTSSACGRLNTSGFPIIEIPLGEHDDIDAVGRFLFDRGIYVTLAAYPLVPRSQVGFRVQVTAANGDDEVEQLNDVLGELAIVLRDAARASLRLNRPRLWQVQMTTTLTRRLGLVAPLRHRDFRLLWTGLVISLLGDGIFLVAVAWEAYRLDDRPSALAGVGLATSAPQVVLLLFGGADLRSSSSPNGAHRGRSRASDRRRLPRGPGVVRAAAGCGSCGQWHS